jgi:hypothetical protein
VENGTDLRIDSDLDWHLRLRSRCVAIGSLEIGFLTGCGKRILFIRGNEYKRGADCPES